MNFVRSIVFEIPPGCPDPLSLNQINSCNAYKIRLLPSLYVALQGISTLPTYFSVTATHSPRSTQSYIVKQCSNEYITSEIALPLIYIRLV